MKLYILLFFITLIVILLFINYKEGYQTPTITYTGKCNNGKDLNIYKNNGLNRWYNQTDTTDILNNIKNVDFSNTIKNECITVNPLKRFHNDSNEPNSQSINKIPFGNTNLSTDNIRLMDACDFYNGYNPVTGKQCIETFMNSLENEYVTKEMETQKKLSFDDKMYLTICSGLFVFLLFKASNKYNL
jgi:hypothetical protein